MKADKVIPENLVAVSFEKFSYINIWSNQSQSGVWRALLHRFIEENFSK